MDLILWSTKVLSKYTISLLYTSQSKIHFQTVIVPAVVMASSKYIYTGHGQYIFHHRIQHNPDCFLKNRPCSPCLAVETNENNQSGDLLLAEREQCHPQGNKVLRDPALIRSAEPFFFSFLITSYLNLIHIHCQGYQQHGCKIDLFRQENVSSSSLQKKVNIFK